MRRDAGHDAYVPPPCPGGGSTTVSGVVRIPAGTLPVPGATVYATNGFVDPIPTGVDGDSCLRCDGELTNVRGRPVLTDLDGSFTLEGVRPGENVPVVVQIGKWRRVAYVPQIVECEAHTLPAEATRLPRNSREGHLPRIALTTGSCDGMECLLRKLGIDDSEFTNPEGPGRVNLYADTVCTTVPLIGEVCESGRNRYSDALGGQHFPSASAFWSSLENLSAYDAVIHSCECSETTDNKPPEAMEALREYADLGGRAFLTHFHYAWLKHSPNMGWQQVATWNAGEMLDSATGQIVTSFDRGMQLADWMMLPEVGGSTVHGSVALRQARQSASGVGIGVQPWVRISDRPTYFSFDTPAYTLDEDTCGRVVFSDIHVSAGDQAQNDPFSGGSDPRFPDGCTDEISPQEKALIYMLFDLTNCVGPPVLY